MIRPVPEEAAREVQLCAFYVGKQEYAVDIRRVAEILQPVPVTALPRAPEFLEGVVNLRGAIIPVVDVRKRLGGELKSTRKTKLLICLIGRKRVALIVDGVSQVFRVKLGDLKPAPPLGESGLASCVMGVCGPPGRLRLLLDVKALLGPPPPRAAAPQGVGP
jgi:purine-binding chemotaxis protein CheW